MAIGAATVGICIAIACVLFLLVSMILIYNNAQYERKRLKVGVFVKVVVI